jgi:hypothetical protein
LDCSSGAAFQVVALMGLSPLPPLPEVSPGVSYWTAPTSGWYATEWKAALPRSANSSEDWWDEANADSSADSARG